MIDFENPFTLRRQIEKQNPKDMKQQENNHIRIGKWTIPGPGPIIIRPKNNK